MRNYFDKILAIPSGNRDMDIAVVASLSDGMRPGVLWLHPGGYIEGDLSPGYIHRAVHLARKYNVVVVCPDYTLARDAPYPAALCDCHAALEWMEKNALDLRIDKRKLIVGGESAGGGLAAALCIYERDIGGIKIAFQMPLYPMLDDRASYKRCGRGSADWPHRLLKGAWAAYLAGVSFDVPPYAAAARVSDFGGLPPLYTFVGEEDAFYDETLAYVDSLRRAGVSAMIDTYPGCSHAFDLVNPLSESSRIAKAKFDKVFEQILSCDLPRGRIFV